MIYTSKIFRPMFSCIAFVLAVLLLLTGSAPAQGMWTAKNPPPSPVTSMAVINGVIYGVESYALTFQAYHPATDSWVALAPLLTGRGHTTAVAANGKLYVLGGCGDNSCSSVVKTVEEYDPTTDAWTTKAPMPTARRDFGAGAVSGKIYAVSGYGGVTANDEYDPTTNIWTTVAPIPTPHSSGAVAVANGTLYVIGGGDPNNSLVLSANNAYDPATNQWSQAAPLPSPAFGAADALNGVVYFYFHLGVADLEAYNPATNSWTAQTPPPSPTSANVAAVNGVLYAIGAEADGVTYSNEAFTPVQTPAQLVSTLVDTVANFNLQQGIQNNLDAKLQAAQASLAGATAHDINTTCNQIDAFINAVSAQSGKQLTVIQANQLNGQAASIKGTLLCP